MILKGNQNDGNAYLWRFGGYATGPRIGGDGSDGYMIARRLGPNLNEPIGQTELESNMIQGASQGKTKNIVYHY